jgi:hypothetical protein
MPAGADFIKLSACTMAGNRLITGLMPPKRRSPLPKPYGRQAEGKTIKSLSLDAELVEWSEDQAAAEGMSFSAWINGILLKQKKSSKPAKKSKKR